jgi:hypothetical protein
MKRETMKPTRTLLAAALVAGAVFSPLAGAQSPPDTPIFVAQGPGGMPPIPPIEGNAMFMLAEFGDINKLVTDKPFSATETLTSTQVLADGNRIVRKLESKTWRDTAGRIRREPVTTMPDGSRPPVMLFDPAAKTAFLLDDEKKTAYKLPPPGEGGRGQRGGPLPDGEKRGSGKFGGETVKEPLGTKTIDGVSAEGTRTTRTIPAGAFGNEKPIAAITERWYSPDLQAYVLVIARDPRFGDTEHRMTAVAKGAVDASLFAVPAGYTISDAPPGPRRMPPR